MENKIPEDLLAKPNSRLVFGSNLSGIHGAGAALYAKMHFGAQHRVGRGLRGKSYALPTKGFFIVGKPLEVRSLRDINIEVRDFMICARMNKSLNFFVTRVGCGLAGYEDNQIAPMFMGSPDNCYFDPTWLVPWGLKSWEQQPRDELKRQQAKERSLAERLKVPEHDVFRTLTVEGFLGGMPEVKDCPSTSLHAGHHYRGGLKV